ncbi:MAG: transketolase [Holosporales bacterium]
MTPSTQRLANALRFLAADAVERAQSGHPGMPLGMADVATVLFQDFLKFDAQHPTWPDRDRFVLSAGHGSMLLYGLTYLSGYTGMDLQQLQHFRQLGYHTAGHPEYDPTLGIETTTGPLGQGLANAVGMALAERLLSASFGKDVVDHYTYVMCGDGCLMEGLSQEAISFAGHYGLGRLIVLWDDNQITIDGTTDLSVSDQQLKRFDASNWHTQAIDGHDPQAIHAALSAAKADPRPSLIACRTQIGHGAPTKAGTHHVHGAPLGKEEIAAMREALEWPHAPFEIPEDILNAWRDIGRKGRRAYEEWHLRFSSMDPETQAEFQRRVIDRQLPHGLDEAIRVAISHFMDAQPKLATRQSSGQVLEHLVLSLPELLGGSADLTPSNNTKTKSQKVIMPEVLEGQYVHYGVREHAMAAIMNGLSVHGGFRPYGGTFLTFTDYARPAIRLSALMQQPVIYVMTHDSIGLGEDGPTHQPIEHLASLRAMPNLLVLRPADAVETAEAWACALKSTATPSILSLTRQSVPCLRDHPCVENKVSWGAYVLQEGGPDAVITLYASGSEVSLAVEVATALQGQGIAASVISVPCVELFQQQSATYQDSILRRHTLRVAIEAGVQQGWERFIGENGLFFGTQGFGASAPAAALYAHFGLTQEKITARILDVLNKH